MARKSPGASPLAEPPERLVTWEAGSGECRIVCSSALLESIHKECLMAAMGLVPLGTGGALLGEFSGGTYRVRSWHPIPCRHQRGPSFLLTKDEVAGLKDFLTRLPAAAGRTEDKIIGWFVSHPHSGAVLRDDEISLHQRFFRSNDLFLLLEIHSDGAAVITVHRGAQAMEPQWRIVPARRARNAVQPATGAELPEPSTGSVIFRSVHGPEPNSARKRRSGGPLIPALTVLSLAVAGFAWIHLRQQPVPPPPVPLQPLSTLSLRVLREGQLCIIRWNLLESWLAVARAAELRITDRGTTVVERLTPAQIRAGAFAYNTASATFEVMMVVELGGGRTLSERVIFFGS